MRSQAPRRARAVVAAAIGASLAFGALAASPDPVRAGHDPFATDAHGWTFTTFVSATDGLVVANGRYRGTRVFERISVPQCRVFYPHGTATMNDNLGRYGNIHLVSGSTRRSTSAQAVEVRAVFECCRWPHLNSYRYRVRYIFYADGRFRPYLYVYGPGIEPRATYECSFRMDLDLDGPGADRFAHTTAGPWRVPRREGGFADDGAHDAIVGAEWMSWDDGGFAFWVKPGANDGGPRLYALREQRGEGERDAGLAVMIPPRFDDDQLIQGTDLVLWYRSATSYRRPTGCPRRRARCAPVQVGPAFLPSGRW